MARMPGIAVASESIKAGSPVYLNDDGTVGNHTTHLFVGLDGYRGECDHLTPAILAPRGSHNIDPFASQDGQGWECPYCFRLNLPSQQHCGQGTTHGCGAGKAEGMIESPPGTPVFAPLGDKTLVGMIDGEHIYDDNPALYYLRSLPEFASVSAPLEHTHTSILEI